MSITTQGYTREQALSSVGKGWALLIDRVCDEIEKSNTKIINVKEKYGGLRIYTDYTNPPLDLIINSAEKESYVVCEVCGSVGVLRMSSDRWYYTSCQEHERANSTIVNNR